jgi:hypothetical protein
MFLHTVYSYSNAVYESLRFGTVKSDSIHHFFGNVRFIAVLSVFQRMRPGRWFGRQLRMVFIDK